MHDSSRPSGYRAAGQLLCFDVFWGPTCELASCCPQVVATHLPPEEIEGIRQMFMDMDRDGSGTISYMELKDGERGQGFRHAVKLHS
jgi:hypothetical protein